jgi:hypothetical protein
MLEIDILTVGVLEVDTRVARFLLVQTYQNGKNIPKDPKLYQTTINYTKWPEIIPNGYKIYKHFSF